MEKFSVNALEVLRNDLRALDLEDPEVLERARRLVILRGYTLPPAEIFEQALARAQVMTMAPRANFATNIIRAILRAAQEGAENAG